MNKVNKLSNMNKYFHLREKEKIKCCIIFFFHYRFLPKVGQGRGHLPIHRLALDSVITSKGNLILLNGPNAIEVHKVYSNNLRKIHMGFP